MKVKNVLQNSELLEWLDNPAMAVPALPMMIALNDYAVLACQGQDAKRFLQGQLSCDLEAVNLAQSQLGCYCDHKGRMLANFWLGQNQQAYVLVLPKNIYANCYKELNKFAAFSKVTLTDISAAYQQVGLVSDENLTMDTARRAPTIKYIYNHSMEHLLLPKTCSINGLDNIANVEKIIWELANIRQGIMCVIPETIGLFTPHEVNFAQIGGVSLNKGCYRGQEIIARMHYLGKLKQHLYHCRLQSSEKLIAGTELITAEQKHLGKIVNAVATNNNYYEILAVLYDAIVADQPQIKLDNSCILNIIRNFFKPL